MIAQKTNFTRNMLVIIPFLSIIASLAFIRSLDALKLEKRPRAFAIVAFILIGLGYPLRESFVARAETLAFVDSRSILGSELLKSGAAQSPENKTQVALSGQLQFPLGMYTSGPFARFNQITSSPLELYGRGFDKLVLSPAWGIAERERSLFATSERILGELKQQRIIHDPAIEILEARPSAALTAALTELATKDRELQIDVLLSPPTGTTKACSVSGGLSPASASETYCWGQGRVVFLRFSDLESALRTAPNTSKVTVYLDAMTPWSGNKIRFFLGNWSETRSFDQGVWASTSIQPPLAAMNAAGGIFVEIEKVLSPKLQGISADDRNLGAAFKNIRLDGSRN